MSTHKYWFYGELPNLSFIYHLMPSIPWFDLKNELPEDKKVSKSHESALYLMSHVISEEVLCSLRVENVFARQLNDLAF